jgi:hypothetical protein
MDKVPDKLEDMLATVVADTESFSSVVTCGAAYLAKKAAGKQLSVHLSQNFIDLAVDGLRKIHESLARLQLGVQMINTVNDIVTMMPYRRPPVTCLSSTDNNLGGHL